MELSILTKCNILLAVYDPIDMKLTSYRSSENDDDFLKQMILIYEKFSDNDVSRYYSTS